MIWLSPWHPIENKDGKKAIEAQLYLEVNEKHFLHGKRVKAVAYKENDEKNLFKLLDRSGRHAVVSMEFSNEAQKDPSRPKIIMFDSIEDFKNDYMLPLHQLQGL